MATYNLFISGGFSDNAPRYNRLVDTSFPVIQLDVTESYTITLNNKVTSFPVESRSNIADHIYSENITATGKHVVVIGGGDTGSDCVGTSNRQGAASVTQFELLPKPPEARNGSMPWPTYPMLLKTSTSHEEGCDRMWAVTTKAFIGDEKGNLKALRIADLEWKSGPDGRPANFIEVPGSEREIQCDLALLAMGFLHPQQEIRL